MGTAVESLRSIRSYSPCVRAAFEPQTRQVLCRNALSLAGRLEDRDALLVLERSPQVGQQLLELFQVQLSSADVIVEAEQRWDVRRSVAIAFEAVAVVPDIGESLSDHAVGDGHVEHAADDQHRVDRRARAKSRSSTS